MKNLPTETCYSLYRLYFTGGKAITPSIISEVSDGYFWYYDEYRCMGKLGALQCRLFSGQTYDKRKVIKFV